MSSARGFSRLVITLALAVSGIALDASGGVSAHLDEPVLLGDLDISPVGGDIRWVVSMGEDAFLRATTPQAGTELYFHDTSAGTTTLIDIRPGPDSSFPDEPVVVGGQLFFAANDGTAGKELWKSNGTVAGTQMVKDINPGADGSDIDSAVLFDGEYYFAADDGVHELEVWRSDGSTAGTEMIGEINADGPGYPYGLTVVGADAAPPGVLYMSGYSGPDAGTEVIRYRADINAFDEYDLRTPYGSSPGRFTDVDGALYFAADASTSAGTTLHRIADPANAVPVIEDLSDVVNPSEFVAEGDDLWLRAEGTGGLPALWRVPSALSMPTEIPDTAGSDPGSIAVFPGSTIIVLSAENENGEELWAANTGGFFRTWDINPGPASSSPSRILIDPDVGPGERWMVFWAYLDDQPQMYRLDTSVGTTSPEPFPGLQPLDDGAIAFEPDLIGGGYWFVGNDGVHGDELWYLESDFETIERKTDIGTGTRSSWPHDFTPIGNSVLFAGSDDAAGDEPRLYNPATGAITMLRDLVPGPGSSYVRDVTPYGDRLIFEASSSLTVDSEIWLTDGTTAGTHRVSDTAGDPTFRYPDDFVELDGVMLFSARSDDHGEELWRTDGTVAGTKLVSDVATGVASSGARSLVAFAGKVFFIADDGASGYELWQTDGTTAGTRLAVDLAPGPDSADVYDVALWGDELVVWGGGGIWRSDGTLAGTTRVPLGAAPEPEPSDIGVAGNRLYVSTWNAGTHRLFSAGPSGPAIEIAIPPDLDLVVEEGVAIGNDLFVVGDSGFSEPYSEYVLSSSAATMLDIVPVGDHDDDPIPQVAYQGWVYLTAEDETYGAELWRTNGSTSERLSDIATGPADATPIELAVVGHTLYFAATTPAIGYEPYRLDLSHVPSAPTGVTAVAGSDGVTVSWSAPADPGGAPVSYVVTASPGGRMCATSGALSCTVTGLTPGVMYRFTVVASNVAGSSVASSPSAPVEAQAAAGIVPIEPGRFWDSRNEPTFDGLFSNTGFVAEGSVERIQISGRGSVPDGAEGVVGNLTVILPDAAGFATLYPCTADVPTASNLNYAPGDVLANNTTVPLNAAGEVCVFSRAGAHYALDVNGFVPAGSAVTGIDPARYLDTRETEETFDGLSQGGGPIAAMQMVEVEIAGRGTVPADARAAIVNITVIAPDAGGFATVYPCGDRPATSNLNYATGQVVPNGAVTQLSASGTVCLFTRATAHLAMDVSGYIPAGTDSVQTRAPSRLLDTRDEPTIDGLMSNVGRNAAEGVVEVQITGRAGVPAGATAAILNIGVVAPDGPGFATLYPCGGRPTTSNINHATGGVVRANNAITKLSPTGTVCIFTKSSTDLILDITGWLE